jgi:hypothetical protein
MGNNLKYTIVCRLLEFLPLNRRSEDVLAASFASRDLAELLRLHRAQASQVHDTEIAI